MNNKVKIIIADSRKMLEVNPGSVDLVLTSPPYWHIKNYGTEGQIGYGQTLHEYLKDLYLVWQECYDAIKPGRRLCINIGDQFARAVVYGRYKIIPLHAEFIGQCEDIGFDYMGSIIWQKKTTMNTTGRATVMGSYPYPPNGMVEIDYEFILIFKKPGKSGKIPGEIKEASKMTREEWKEYFYGHWYFGGARQIGHEAMFPDELPKRIIKMFSLTGETVLDPFLGSGTTIKAALNLNRNAIGYEINENFLDTIKEKAGLNQNLLAYLNDIQIIKRTEKIPLSETAYRPRIKDVKPQVDPNLVNEAREKSYRVLNIIDESTLHLNTNQKVKLLGLDVRDKKATLHYLKKYVLKKEVFLKFDSNYSENADLMEAYVYLKNKIFVNAYLIKAKMATVDKSKEFAFKNRFLKLEASI